MKRGKLFFATRFFVRLWTGRWRTEIPAPQGPTVYVCHHGNMRGPITTLAWFPFPVRPWVFYMFTSRKDCQTQYQDYTFSQRYGMPKPVAGFLAWIVSGYVSRLMTSLGAIPVYRGGVKIGATFRETVAALQEGDPALIFPDVEYASSAKEVGEVYDGFLLLHRFWRRVSNVPLSFVPLRLKKSGKVITAGEAVQWNALADPKKELVRVREALRTAMYWDD